MIKPFKIENWWLIVRLESFATNFDNGFIIEDQSYALYKDWLLGEAVKILSSIKCDESDQSMVSGRYKLMINPLDNLYEKFPIIRDLIAFSDISDDIARQLSTSCKRHYFSIGDYLCRKNIIPSEIFLINKGKQG